MSQLIDKLNLVAKSAPQPMGFRAGQPASASLKMVLIAGLTQTKNVTGLAGYVNGADAVLLPITRTGAGVTARQKLVESLPDIPWGRWLADTDEKETGKWIEAGCDFVVFPAASTVLTTSQDDKLGRILQVELSLGEGLLRAVNELPVDAVLAADGDGEGSCLTWHHLMLFQRLANLLTKPLLVSVPSGVTAGELQVLWGVGVDGVVAAVGPEPPAGRLAELRRMIDSLKLPPRKRGKAEALLPRIGGETGTAEEVEEEEEEEDLYQGSAVSAPEPSATIYPR